MVQLLLTRPQADSARFAAQLQAAAVEAVPMIAPLMRIERLPVPELSGDQAVIFTSRNGVWALPDGAGRLAYVVGAATDAAAQKAGYITRVADGDAEALFRRIMADHAAGTFQGGLHHIRGRHARGNLAARLTDAGVPTEETVAYEQVAQHFDSEIEKRLQSHENLMVALFSPRSASLFAAECQRIEVRAPLTVAAFSPAVAEALGPLPVVQCDVLPKPETSLMIDTLSRQLRNLRRLEGEI
ncbi:uroporphyrinogen-III synthase [Thalassobius sp. Cn5-15]|uniref:uroporphyrinogen-III synthase n=1 Tax=Thalassobius sp. Cn5-15 TaxID=2917763 RepID=UPI001EF18A57|nr:uroporphyrinogen-III synthase [Thalassobius sp. Cn5-15]MCG7493899.1 uroporphyrinogen-III synthase [Thalassobius sp. Cn5-15]